jgi:hypothetical protein
MKTIIKKLIIFFAILSVSLCLAQVINIQQQQQQIASKTIRQLNALVIQENEINQLIKEDQILEDTKRNESQA